MLSSWAFYCSCLWLPEKAPNCSHRLWCSWHFVPVPHSSCHALLRRSANRLCLFSLRRMLCTRRLRAGDSSCLPPCRSRWKRAVDSFVNRPRSLANRQRVCMLELTRLPLAEKLQLKTEKKTMWACNSLVVCANLAESNTLVGHPSQPKVNSSGAQIQDNN